MAALAASVVLRARVVLPISRPPVENGFVHVLGNRIQSVGRWDDFSPPSQAPVLDLGNSILLPGLINAHCHLDYTDMAGMFPPTKTFTDWVKLITTAKAQWSPAEYIQSWLNGSSMLVRTGTTTVADIEAIPEVLPDVWQKTPLRVFSFLEMTGVKSRRSPNEILQETVEKIETLPQTRCRPGLSPHAPYSTVPELLRLSAEVARQKQWRLSVHVAESPLEFDMFRHGRGEMYDWLRRNDRDMSDCGLGTPVKHLHRLGILNDNLLAIHANYLENDDINLLSQNRVHVVHCPRSHTYFNYTPFRWNELLEAGVNICLGTDSLASMLKIQRKVPELNLFEEMRTFAQNASSLPPQTILQMVTVNPARALGMPQQIGELRENSYADLIAIPFSGSISESYDAVLHFAGTVSASMIDGEWAVTPKQG